MLGYAARVAARVVPSRHGTILCFHGVEPSRPPNVTSAHVSLRQIRDTLAMARSVAEPVPLRELIKRHDAGRSTAGLFAVTFDDAYRSLATDTVREVLSGLPITIFVVTGASAAGATFWWDRVEALHHTVSTDEWARFERVIGLPDDYRTPESIPFGPLRPLRQWVLHHFAGRWPREAEDALNALERTAGSATSQRAMTFEEIDDLKRRGPVDIGVHTVSHPVLPLLGDEEARDEIGRSFATLRERWPTVIPWLAAPFGQYDDRTARLARESGLAGILTLHPYTVAQASVVHGFPRTNITEGVRAWRLGLRLTGLAPFIARPPSGAMDYPGRPAPD